MNPEMVSALGFYDKNELLIKVMIKMLNSYN